MKLRADRAGSSAFGDKAGSCGYRGLGDCDLLHHAKIRSQRFPSYFTADIASLTVVQLDLRILGEIGLHCGIGILPIATGCNRSADQFRGNDWRPKLAVIELEIADPVGVNVARDHDRV